MKALERFLISLDCGVWSALTRVAIGLCIPLAFSAVFGYQSSTWNFIVFFLAVLVALRVAPAILRRLLPFSADAKETWAERRFLAKRYDSYQWQKLFWIGLGLLPHVLIAGETRTGEIVVTSICLLGGGFGLLVWRRISIDQTSSAAL